MRPPSATPSAPEASGPPRRLAKAGVCLILVALPFLVSRFPPITDLPQHAAQIRLLGEALGEHRDLYRVQWLTPYGLSYLLPGLGWLLGGPLAAGRLGFLFAACLWAGALHGIAARRARAPESAVLAAVFVFSHALYWGFLGFLAGFAAFAVWLRATEANREDAFTVRKGAGLVAAGALLYFTHALWFAVGCLWLVLDGLRSRLGARALAARVLCLAPFGALAALWFPGLARRGFDSAAHWPDTAWERFSPDGFTAAALGGLRGPLEPLALAAVLAWVALSAWQRRGEGRRAWDGRLVLLAALLLAGWAMLPVKAMNTIFLAERWLPCALAVLVVAAPAPRLGRAGRPLAAVLLAAFVAGTSAFWIACERTSFSGLDAVLGALPVAPRVLGLSWARSPLVAGDPFRQTFAYAQVARGGELNFSFADFAPALVVYREPRKPAWTSGLEWFPERATRSDLGSFEFVIAGGGERDHARLRTGLGLEPATAGGTWRLYRLPAAARRAGAAEAAPARAAPGLVEVVSGLERPLFVTHAGDGSGRLFVVEQGGRIRILRDGRLLERPFLDATDWLDTSAGERGLLGLAFAPDFRRSGVFYIAHTAPGPEVRIVRLRRAQDPDRADPASAELVLSMPDPAPNHNGGMIAFGPDGYLWIGTGDGGGAGDPWDNARRAATLLGKILRIDVSGRPYTVPAGNPLVGRAGARPEIWALGLRNPWRFSFDRATGELWIGDVGQGAWEEIDVEAPRQGGGLDYGWRTMEGRHCFRPRFGCGTAGLALPVHEYGHDEGCAVTGGYVYRGHALSALVGRYLFADYCSGTVWALERGAAADAAPRVERLLESGAMVSSFGEDEAGEIYLCDHRGGRVLRLAVARDGGGMRGPGAGV